MIQLRRRRLERVLGGLSLRPEIVSLLSYLWHDFQRQLPSRVPGLAILYWFQLMKWRPSVRLLYSRERSKAAKEAGFYRQVLE